MLAEYKEISPAKINFVLELLSKRDDNFHNISSIMAPISLYDEITIVKSKVNSINYFFRIWWQY